MLAGERDRLEEKVLEKDVPKEDVAKKYNNQPGRAGVEAAPEAITFEAALWGDREASGPRGEWDAGGPGEDQVRGGPEGNQDTGGPGGEPIGVVPGVNQDSGGPGNNQVGDGVPAGHGGDWSSGRCDRPGGDEVWVAHGEVVLLLQLEVVLLLQ